MAVRRDRFRLRCMRCDVEEDCTLTPAEAKKQGWTGIERVQTYKQSIQTEDLKPPYDAPSDWMTHEGLCPQCSREGEIA